MQLAEIRPEHVMAARQELARRSLADFACMVDIPTVPLSDESEEDGFSVMKLDSLAEHHALLCEKLQAANVVRDQAAADLAAAATPPAP